MAHDRPTTAHPFHCACAACLKTNAQHARVLGAFDTARTKVERLIAELQDVLIENFNGVDPLAATWTDVETLESYVAALRELTDRACRRGEYAPADDAPRFEAYDARGRRVRVTIPNDDD